MSNVITIKAEPREETGKKISKKLRKQGMIPSIIYGGDKESIPISVKLSDIKRILKSEKRENSILKIERGDIVVDSMLKELQYDYLDENIIHADFIRIDLDKTIDVWVHVELEGEPVGVKVEDGILDFVTREIELRSLPNVIPNKIVVDISDLHAGHSIKVEDLKLEEGVQFLSDPSTVICAVTSKVAEEEVAAEEEEVVEEGVDTEEKAEEAKKEEESKEE